MIVIKNRTFGPAPVMMGNVNDEASDRDASRDEFLESEDRELRRLEIRNGKKVFTKPRHDSSKGKTRGKGRSDKECFRCGRIGTSEPETSQNVPLGTIDLGSFEVLSDNVDDDDFSEDALEEVSRTLQWRPPRRRGDRRGEESPFFDCWDCKHEQSDVLQQVDPRVRNAPKLVPSVKSCLT